MQDAYFDTEIFHLVLWCFIPARLYPGTYLYLYKANIYPYCLDLLLILIKE